MSQSFPFSLPDQITATLNVNTRERERANSRLLSVNLDWINSVFNNQGYNQDEAKEFVRELNPISLRWPQGAWANFYDYETDSRQRGQGYDNKEFNAEVDGNPDLRFGFDGFRQLHDELGFDVLWTFNVNDDTPEKSVARLKDRESKGFDITHIELGNEQFWESQRGPQTATPELFAQTGKAVSRALKEAKPSLKISIPLSWRSGHSGSILSDGRRIDHTDYNCALTKDQTYFDAITVHRYVHLDRNSEAVSCESYRGVLTARVQMQDDVAWCRSFAPDKPVWLSEWGISAGYRAASFLGSADAYLFLFENQDVYEYANWFQVNNYDAHFKWHRDEAGVAIPTKTGFGAVYEIIRNFYHDSEMLAGEMETVELASGCDAVVARAVAKGEQTSIIAVNKTPQNVPFTVKFDGEICVGPFTHKALAFADLDEDKTFGLHESPLELISHGEREVTLPPFSISVITTPIG